MQKTRTLDHDHRHDGAEPANGNAPHHAEAGGLPLDEHTRAFIDFIIEQAIERCLETKRTIPGESPSTQDSPRNDNGPIDKKDRV